MHMRTGIPATALVLLILVTAQVSGADITRTVMTENNTTVVTLVISERSVIGITETLPAGTTLAGCSLPPEQYRFSDGALHLAVIGERELSYTIQGAGPLPVSGTWIDFLDGSRGTIPAEGQSLPGGRPTTPSPPATVAPGFTSVAVLGALAMLILLSCPGRWDR